MSYAEIWKTLSAVDVSKHIEKKQGLSYLSWAWAWGVLMDHYPSATYEFPEPEIHQDGSVTVHCKVSIGDCSRTMWLPVMDHRNQAIKQPDALKISNSRMRCLVKCLAMFGLGHYIYAGEELPADAEPAEAPKKADKESPKKAKTVATKTEEHNVPTPEAAEEVVVKLLEFAKKFCTDLKGLRSFWSENKSLIDIIDANYPHQYKVLKDGFTELKSSMGDDK